jgi:hypothetical protein
MRAGAERREEIGHEIDLDQGGSSRNCQTE